MTPSKSPRGGKRAGRRLSLKEAIQRWKATGRIAIYHPRKRTISLDGGRAMGEDAAVQRIQEFLDRLAV